MGVAPLELLALRESWGGRGSPLTGYYMLEACFVVVKDDSRSRAESQRQKSSEHDECTNNEAQTYAIIKTNS